ncbi:zinc finger CCCH domain-containing protein 7B [Ambystoma mexicanum]|uniref:zinc finger CCCH domain-containing protein 7B n=1 Tax=Ambystoma mexicanum TaxID=8296 RepID=UPI0037E7D781
MERQRRKQEIEKGLQFIQSTIPYPGSQEEYEDFLHKLVQNLFAEGNDLYREGDLQLALGQYTEGLTVSEYGTSDGVTMALELDCKLYINRAACYFNMELYEKALEDCETALQLDKDNMRALFRKARTLHQLGRHKEASDCNRHCLLSHPNDESVISLGQELSQKLGLRVRKAYKRPMPDLESYNALSNGTTNVSSNQMMSNGLGSIDDIEIDFPQDLKCIPAPVATSIPVSDASTPQLKSSPSSVGLLSADQRVSVPVPESVDEFPDDVLGDELDSILDSISETPAMAPFQGVIAREMPHLIPVFPGGAPLLPAVVTANIPVSSPLPPASFGRPDTRKLSVLDSFETTPVGTSGSLDSLDVLHYPEPMLDRLDSFDSSRGSLDALDSFVSDSRNQESRLSGGLQRPTPAAILNSLNNMGLPKLDPYPRLMEPAAIPPGTSLLVKNPLASTHEFRQGCHTCYQKTGPKVLDCTYRDGLEHKCKRDLLLGRLRKSEDKTWKRIRPRPAMPNFVGSYYLCKDVLSTQNCKFGDHCTFAYYQEEIDVWTEERKGTLRRELLFHAPRGPGRANQTVAKLLQDHQGIFSFLCQVCFDSKPRIISERSKVNSTMCANPASQHHFDDNKCLIHVLFSGTVKYSKIRPFHERFQLDVCRHEMRYGCQQEDACHFAHSFMELRVWLLQQNTGILHEEILLESRAIKAPCTMFPSKVEVLGTPDLKMKFVCSQCWQHGNVIEPDKDLKYCSAKARHNYTKDRRILLVMSKAKKKWIAVRPLPSVRSFPQQYDLCIHIQKGRKCQYVGTCTFAHSPEEKDLWTFMKEKKVYDLQVLYDMSLKNNNQGKSGDGNSLMSREVEKQIHMPTDYADIMTGFHCRFCGKNSNSERQWQQHIQSEKHKEKVVTSESDAICWSQRFPMGEFKVCEKYKATKSCPDGENCRFAHGEKELLEWLDRREVLKQKLAKARRDMLLGPNDKDFGKYNFLVEEEKA